MSGKVIKLLLILNVFVAFASAEDDEKIDLSHFGDSIFGDPIVNLVANRDNPEERGPYLEGDLLIPNRRKNGLKLESTRWPRGQVPYVIGPGFSPKELKRIQQAFDEYHKKTCIKFFPKRQSDKDFISIESGATGCWSTIGKQYGGGKQIVNLQTGNCLETLGTPVHELMHALGFLHEQSREDRDKFVTILLKNIISGKTDNFEKAKSGTTTAFGVGYDYGSVMHYSAYAFSKNQQPTIVAKQNTNQVMGQRNGFSGSDLEKIRKMYKC